MTRQFEGTEKEFVYDSEAAPNMQPVSMSMFASKDDMLRHLLKEREQSAALITSQAAEIERLEKADETRARDISRLAIERDAARDRLEAQIDYSCDLQRIIEDLCRGGPVREPKTSARHHYDMATAFLSALEAQLAERVKVMDRLVKLAEKRKAYHKAKQNEFPSIEQCVDEDGAFRSDQNLYGLLQGEAANGRYSEADWWLCTIRAETTGLSALEATPAPMVTFPGCVVSLNGTKISMAFETDEDAQTVFRLIEYIIDSTASEAKQ